MTPDDPIAAARAVLSEFEITGELVELAPFERGHIHDTSVSTWRTPEGLHRYLHQRINRKVFADVDGLMHNVERVTRHLEERGEMASGGFHVLRLVPTRAGESWLRHASGCWRTYDFIENTESFDLCAGPQQAYQAASAFGRFQACLRDLDPAELRVTIPRFFDAPHRLVQLEEARARASADRLCQATAELEFVDARRELAPAFERLLAAGRVPRRIVHGDTKLNNVLFDRATGEAVSVVDLDTCMPAWSLYDFGDLVRFTAATCAEDERDLSRARMDLGLYRALAEGYLEHAGAFLTRQEIELMPLAARLVTFMLGVRFLTDHLAGDVYFRVARPGHNLDRARVQLAIVASMEASEAEMMVA